MARWAPGFLERKDDASQRSVAQPLFAFGHPYLTNWNVQRAVKDGYERVTWVFRAIDAIASNAARLSVQVHEENRWIGKPLPSDRVEGLDRLNQQTNIWESSLQFRYRLSTLLLLSKVGVFVEVQRDNAGRLINAYILPTQYTYPIPDPDNYVAGYRVWVGGVQPVDLPPEQVVWIRKPHPIDAYSGVTPLEPAGISVDMDFWARVYTRTFMANDGRPGGILGVSGRITEPTAQKLQDRFNAGPAVAGRTAVVQADDLKWVDTSITPRDAQYVESRKLTKEEILLAFGVPESMIGNASGRCVDRKTEAFTKRGWLTGDQITTADTILSLDPATGRLVWGPVREVYRNDRYSGPMYRLRHSHADFLVTPGHKWAVVPRPGQGRRTTATDAAVLRRVEDLSTHDRIVAMGTPEDSLAEPVYSSAFVELVGWAVTEGSFDKPAYIRISQNEGEHADRIRRVLKECGAQWSEGFQKDRPLMRRFYVRGETALAVTAAAPDKVIPLEFLLSLTAAQRELLLQTQIDADGSRQGTGSWTFCQEDPRRAESFAALATLAGYRTSIRPRKPKDGFRQTQVIVSRRRTMTVQRATRTVEHYDGMVWCPRTDYGTFVCRREGRVVVTGNTFANADAEKEIFWRETMLPHLDLLGDGMDRILGNGRNNLYCGFDLSGVAVLSRDQRERDQFLMSLVQGGFITLDEAREESGRAALGIPASRSLRIPTTVQLIPASEDDRPALTPAPSPTSAGTVQAAQIKADAMAKSDKEKAKLAARNPQAAAAMNGIAGGPPANGNGNGANGNGKVPPSNPGTQPAETKALAQGPQAAGLAVVARDTGRVLMLQRSDEPDDPAAGRWEFPGGCLEDGEAPLAAALREWSEETGVPPPAGHMAGSWDSPNGVYRGFVMAVPYEDDVNINADHDRRRVLNPDDPDGDGIEVCAWWTPQHARDNPALRDEARSGTDWDLIFRTAGSVKALPAGAGPGGALTSGQPQPRRGVMVGAFIDPDVARQLVHPHGEDPEKMHVTLAYLGQQGDPNLDLERAARAVDGVASRHAPLVGEVNGQGVFHDADGDQEAHVALVDAPGLNRLREAVVGALRDAGQPVNDEHGFTPHVTVKYARRDDEDVPVVPDHVPLRIHRITLASGDQLVHFPLAGREGSSVKADAAQALIDWYLAGAGGQVDWSAPDAAGRCAAVASRYMGPAEAKAFAEARLLEAKDLAPL